jgi:NAD+ synthase (glutamine-hydrolysing)
MKVGIGQINTTPNDFEGNFEKIEKYINAFAESKLTNDGKEHLLVFPELVIGGYLSKDLMYSSEFIENNLIYLQKVADLTKQLSTMYVVVGYVEKNCSGIGKPFKNMLAVLSNGHVVGKYQKRLIPFYDVFDEGRYFEQGNDFLILKIGDERVGFTICEDVWFEDKGSNGQYRYDVNPVEEYAKRGVDVIVNISSSPFIKGKQAKRQEMIEEIATTYKVKMVYVNQIGAQDSLVFDGNSFIVDPQTSRCHTPWSLMEVVGPDNYFSDIDVDEFILDMNYLTIDHKLPSSEIESVYKACVAGIHDYVKKSGFTSVVTGSSGGIDSAVVIALASKALGGKNVHAIMMPSIYSSDHSISDAQELHERTWCNEYMVKISHKSELEHIVSSYKNSEDFKFENRHPVADENFQARQRGQIVMDFSNAYGSMPMVTSNKSEAAVGYTTICGGDSSGTFAPICDLYKMEVYELAKYMNTFTLGDLPLKPLVPLNIIDKAPSAELAEGQSDEDSLLPYPLLDLIVKTYIEDYIGEYYAFIKHTGCQDINKPDYDRIAKLIHTTEYKRRIMTIGPKVSKVAFGEGRRLPIVKG